jgi:hypothetical protein
MGLEFRVRWSCLNCLTEYMHEAMCVRVQCPQAVFAQMLQPLGDQSFEILPNTSFSVHISLDCDLGHGISGQMCSLRKRLPRLPQNTEAYVRTVVTLPCML